MFTFAAGDRACDWSQVEAGAAPWHKALLSPIATASIVINTTVAASLFTTSAFANKGSFTGPAGRSVMSTFATPAGADVLRGVRFKSGGALAPSATVSIMAQPNEISLSLTIWSY